MVLVKGKKKRDNKMEKEKRSKKRFSSFRRRDWQADSEGRAENWFSSSLSLFFSFSISILLHLSLFSHFLSGIVLSVRSCHDKAVYFYWLTFCPVPFA